MCKYGIWFGWNMSHNENEHISRTKFTHWNLMTHMRVNELGVLIGRHYCAGVDPMMTYYQLAPWEQTSKKFESKRKSNWFQEFYMNRDKSLLAIKFNSFWPSDALWRCNSDSTLMQALGHRATRNNFTYHQCILWHSHEQQYPRTYSWYQSVWWVWKLHLYNHCGINPGPASLSNNTPDIQY